VEEYCSWVDQLTLQKGPCYDYLQRDAVDGLALEGRVEDLIVLVDVLCDCLDGQVDRCLAKLPLMRWSQLVPV
jgi:hypothetical protein